MKGKAEFQARAKRQRFEGGYVCTDNHHPSASCFLRTSSNLLPLFSRRVLPSAMVKHKLSHTQNQNLPAHETKHLPRLEYTFRNSTFRLVQRNDGSTNGTALWMGAQALAAWLAEQHGKKQRPKKSAQNRTRRPRVLELGSGIGLTAYVSFLSHSGSHVFYAHKLLHSIHFVCSLALCSLAMCSMGWDVFATDLPDVVDSVLSQNIAENESNLPPGSGTVQVRVLDWNVLPAKWVWFDNRVIASETRSPSVDNIPSETNTTHSMPAFDLIISADTVYSLSLVAPLLRTVDHLCNAATADETTRTQRPSIYICLERRDPIVIEHLLEEARRSYLVEQVHERVMLQAMEKNGLTWSKDDWDGLEIWQFCHPDHK